MSDNNVASGHWAAIIASIITGVAVVVAAYIGTDASRKADLLREENERLRREKAAPRESISAPSSEPLTSAQESSSISSSVSRGSGRPTVEESKRGDILPRPASTPIQPKSTPPSGDSPAESVPLRLFETESYRLAAEDVKKSGRTVRVTMVLEAIAEGSLTFRAGGWYLLDENGERWEELRPEPALEREQRVLQRTQGTQSSLRYGIRLVSGTRVRDSLVFSATGSGQGASFTLIGIEGSPQTRRDIVLRGLVSNDG